MKRCSSVHVSISHSWPFPSSTRDTFSDGSKLWRTFDLVTRVQYLGVGVRDGVSPCPVSHRCELVDKSKSRQFFFRRSWDSVVRDIILAYVRRTTDSSWVLSAQP